MRRLIICGRGVRLRLLILYTTITARDTRGLHKSGTHIVNLSHIQMKSSTNHVTHPWRYLSCCMRPHTAQSVHCGYQLPAVWPLCRGTGDHCHTESKYCRNIERAVSGVLSLPGYHDTSYLTTSQLSRTWFVKLEPDNNTFARVVLPLGITPRASSELTNI